MKQIIQRWPPVRIIRLVAGIIVIWGSVERHDWVFGLAGAFLFFAALANIGCCGSAGCAVNPRVRPGKTPDAQP